MTLKTKINLSIIVFIILTILIFAFLIYPSFLKIKEASQEIISQRQKIAELEAKIENLEKFKDYQEREKINLEKMANLFVDPELPIEFINFLEKISSDSQVKLSITPGPSQKGDPWPSMLFQLASVSSFPNFLKFLEKLESSIYLIEIQNLNISRLTESELKLKEFEKLSLGDVKATFSIKVYTKNR